MSVEIGISVLATSRYGRNGHGWHGWWHGWRPHGRCDARHGAHDGHAHGLHHGHHGLHRLPHGNGTSGAKWLKPWRSSAARPGLPVLSAQLATGDLIHCFGETIEDGYRMVPKPIARG